MWLCPIVNLVTPFVSAVLIRNIVPLLVGQGVAFVLAFFGGASGSPALIFVGGLTGGAAGAALTHAEIQKARDEVDHRRNR